MPKGTPGDVTNKLAEAYGHGAGDAERAGAVAEARFTTVGTGPEDTLETSREETQMWCATIEKAGISIE